MTFLYHTGIRAYIFFIWVASLFNSKARLLRRGRKNWKKKLAGEIETNARYLWVHCASLGEFEQGRPVIEKLKKEYPDHQILLTFFSPSGYEVRKNYKGADLVTYLPMDGLRNARKFFELTSPEKIFFVKYEFWYFYLKEARKRDIPTYSISAIFRKEQLFFKWYGRWYRKILDLFSHIFVQNEDSKNILVEQGINHVSVSGDTRFDRVKEIASQAKDIPLAAQFAGNHKVIVAGSTWRKDEAMIIRFMEETDPGLKLILAPHEVHESNIQRIVSFCSKIKAIRFSEAKLTTVEKFDVLIIDSIGMLSSLYQYGTIAYIGGGFGKGIHNILEPASFGLPVFFGPNYHKFKEAVDLTELQGAFSFNQYSTLFNLLNFYLDHQDKLKQVGAFVKGYVENNSGSTSYILQSTMP